LKVVPTSDRTDGPEDPPRRRHTDEKSGPLSRLPKWALVTIVGVSWSAILALCGVIVMADTRWRTQLETSVAQANADAQGHLTERMATVESELRAMKEANALRQEADRRRDAQIDRLIDVTGRLANRLDVFVARWDQHSREGSN